MHHEIVVETEHRDYLIHTTDYHEVGLKVGLRFGPDEIHVMYPMELRKVPRKEAREKAEKYLREVEIPALPDWISGTPLGDWLAKL